LTETFSICDFRFSIEQRNGNGLRGRAVAVCLFKSKIENQKSEMGCRRG